MRRRLSLAAPLALLFALHPLAMTPASAQAVTCFGVAATIVGTNNDDVLVGTPGRDVIVGLGGNDTIQGLGGNDLICGGDGSDDIDGGDGNDSIHGDAFGPELGIRRAVARSGHGLRSVSRG
jgi:Ca2+-binding RTX toxin-like protein